MNELGAIGKIKQALDLAKVAQVGVTLAYFDVLELSGYIKALEETAAEPSMPDVSVDLRKYGDEVMEIVAQVLSGENVHYLSSNANGRKYIRWGAVEKDIRAIFEKGGES